MPVARTPKTRSIMVISQTGTAIVRNIPSTAKITFGPMQPGQKGSSYPGTEAVLRIYTSLSNQLAVFRNVLSFRDLSLDVEIEQVDVQEASHSHDGPGGSVSSRELRVSRQFVQQAVPVVPVQ